MHVYCEKNYTCGQKPRPGGLIDTSGGWGYSRKGETVNLGGVQPPNTSPQWCIKYTGPQVQLYKYKYKYQVLHHCPSPQLAPWLNVLGAVFDYSPRVAAHSC